MHVFSGRHSVDQAPWSLDDDWCVYDLVVPARMPDEAATRPTASRRAVLLSALGAVEGQTALARVVAAREAAVLQHLDDAVILRTGPIVEDLAIYVEGIRTHGAALHAYGDADIAWLSVDDVREAARAATKLHRGGVAAFELAGAAGASAEALLRAAAGRPDASVWAIPPSDLVRELDRMMGGSTDHATIARYQEWAASCAHSTDDLARALGRPPTPPLDTLRRLVSAAPANRVLQEASNR